MTYTAKDVNCLSYHEWMETMAKELNKAGFKQEGYSEIEHRFIKNSVPYKVSDDRYFFMGALNEVEAIDFLKNIGLIDNGRCPLCGSIIKGQPSRFTSGLNKNLTFQICSSCRREGQRISLNQQNNSGCILFLIIFPWYILKNIFTN